jgi:FixJ family two-component response regulator
VPQKPLIACVDDDESVREALEGFLKASGFNSGVFSSADEFLQSAWLDETACLITDIHLGGMSGLQLQGPLVALGYAIPIIVITAFPSERVRERALSAGSMCFLDKPFNNENLLTGIRSALDRRHDDCPRRDHHESRAVVGNALAPLHLSRLREPLHPVRTASRTAALKHRKQHLQQEPTLRSQNATL